MALAFLFPHPKLVAPDYDPKNGSYSYFGGDFQTKEVPDDTPGKFTSWQLFKAGSPHTVEQFEVISGTLRYKIEGNEGKLEAGEKRSIPTYARHTFWNDPSTGKDLEVLITVSGGENEGFSDDFVHNFYGYLSSMTMQGKKPNPLQMLSFLHSADVALADIPFCFYLAPAVKWLFGKVIGQYIAGYQTSYKVFSQVAR